jgi:hypothetical protein
MLGRGVGSWYVPESCCPLRHWILFCCEGMQRFNCGKNFSYIAVVLCKAVIYLTTIYCHFLSARLLSYVGHLSDYPHEWLCVRGK